MMIRTIILLLFCTQAFAANYCVGPSASGSGSGADWSNQKAWTDTPARGDTWYLRAATNYASKTFAAALSGTTLITIKKAMTNDHVTATGWSDWMGGQAVLLPTIRVNTGYYVFNGGYRDESNAPYSWTNRAAYGFLLTNSASSTTDDQQMWITSPSYGSPSTAASHVVVSNMAVIAVYSSLNSGAIRRYSMDCDTGDNSTIHNNLLFSRMWIDGGNQHWFLRQTDGAIVEYSASTRCGSSPANHGENVNLYFTSDNAVIRYNWFFNNFNDSPGYSSGGTAVIALTQSDNAKIYGNVFQIFFVGDAVAGFIGGSGSGSVFYNNTVVGGIGASACGVQFGSSGSVIENNIFLDNSQSPSFTAGTRNYNAYSDGTHSESQGQGNLTTAVFVDYPDDLRQDAHTTAGITLSSPYTEDMLGTARGTDSVWDRGAFQYDPTPPAVTNLTITGQVSITGKVTLQ